MDAKIYGHNHSPWVQAVLLGLHEKKIKYTLYQTPPFEILKIWGVYMPAAALDGNSWEVESSKILKKIGFNKVSEQDIRAAQDAWKGVLHRPDNPFKFFSAWAHACDLNLPFLKSLINSFLLSFTCFYMFLLINIIKVRFNMKDPENFGDQYLFWEKELLESDGSFIDGLNPGTRDFLLFGVIQCHSSLPVPALKALQKDERLFNLRNWILKMHERFEDYPHLYSGEFFEPNLPLPKSSSFLQRIFFYFGIIIMFLAFPITLPLALFLMKKAPR